MIQVICDLRQADRNDDVLAQGDLLSARLRDST
jgi:hypothetical protein